jgi:hypothetical protein
MRREQQKRDTHHQMAGAQEQIAAFFLKQGGGVATLVFFHRNALTRSDGGGQRSRPADYDVEPAGGPVELYVLRLCAQAWPRFTITSSTDGTRFPQVAGAARPARLVAGKRRAAAALIIRIVWARFPFVRKLSATSSPSLVARVDDRRLPLMWSENRACFGGYCMLMPSIAGEQPKLCRSAPGAPSNRSLRSHGRHSDGSASPPPDSAPFRSYSCDGMRRECMYVCAAVQVAPILRIPPRKPGDLSGASPTPRTSRPHAVSTWRGTRNGTSPPYAQA